MGARIKVLREQKKITQEVFFHDTGINIGRIERAERDISMSTLYNVCRYLEVSLKEFFKTFSE
jgi:transcriptional regulator with XRE-family HTH domain